MTTPLWVALIAIGISCLALVVSVMTYRLATKRDEEAREFAMMERQHELLLMTNRLIRDIWKLIEKDKHRAVYHQNRDKLKVLAKKIEAMDFSKMPTRDARRNMEHIFMQLALMEFETEGLKDTLAELKTLKEQEGGQGAEA